MPLALAHRVTCARVAQVPARKLTDDEKRVVLADLDSGEATAAEIASRYGISYRSLMRYNQERKAGAPKPKPEPRPPDEPRVVVVTGDVLDSAKAGLEAGISYLANVAANLKPEVATPAEINAVGNGIVKVLAWVIDVLEHKRREAGGSNSVAAMSDEELIAEAQQIALELASKGSGRAN